MDTNGFAPHEELAKTVLDYFAERDPKELRRFARLLIDAANKRTRKFEQRRLSEADEYAQRAFEKVTQVQIAEGNVTQTQVVKTDTWWDKLKRLIGK